MSDIELKYGFRYDPMEWVENDSSEQGALTRTLVLDRPTAADTAAFQERIDKVLAEQQPDGSFAQDTGGNVLQLLLWGLDPKRDEVRRALDTIAGTDVRDDGTLGIYALRACASRVTSMPICATDRSEPSPRSAGPAARVAAARGPHRSRSRRCGPAATSWMSRPPWPRIWAGSPSASPGSAA